MLLFHLTWKVLLEKNTLFSKEKDLMGLFSIKKVYSLPAMPQKLVPGILFFGLEITQMFVYGLSSLFLCCEIQARKVGSHSYLEKPKVSAVLDSGDTIRA